MMSKLNLLLRGDSMNNLQRLQMEIKGVDLEQDELNVYLLENGLEPFKEYNHTSNDNKKAIYKTALSILESIANNPTLMRTVKVDDMTVSDFHESLMNRIDQLERKIRQMPIDNQNSSIFLLYK